MASSDLKLRPNGTPTPKNYEDYRAPAEAATRDGNPDSGTPGHLTNSDTSPPSHPALRLARNRVRGNLSPTRGETTTSSPPGIGTDRTWKILKRPMKAQGKLCEPLKLHQRNKPGRTTQKTNAMQSRPFKSTPETGNTMITRPTRVGERGRELKAPSDLDKIKVCCHALSSPGDNTNTQSCPL